MNNPDCIFCKIAKGEVSSLRIYEDEHFLAFLDINPQSPGHTQVIPKKHYRWVWEVPEAGAYFEVAKKIAWAQQKAFHTDWILARIIGDEIAHAHIWVFPNNKVTGERNDFVGNAEKIRRALLDLATTN